MLGAGSRNDGGIAVKYDTKSLVKGSFPLLAGLLFLEIMGGTILENAIDSFMEFPLLIAAVPVINCLGGSIGGILGARLSSALHIGYITPNMKGQHLSRTAGEGMATGALTFLAMGALFMFLGMGALLDVDQIVKIALIVLLSGLILTLVVVATSISTAIYSYKLGLDPDDTVIPVITTVADFTGIGCLVLMMMILNI